MRRLLSFYRRFFRAMPVPPYTDVLPRDSEYWERCARHTNKHTARTVQYIYLCDPCAVRLVEEGLNGRPPIYHGEQITGVCGLCNEHTEVTLRQWFACPICWNVVQAYQKGFVAARTIHDYWQSLVQPTYPDFVLEETDELRILPYQAGGPTKLAAAATLEALDFLVVEVSEHAADPRFHIELKAGPGSIDEMREFQLDVNDYNDIVGAVRHTGLPAYVFHVQLGQDYHPPTRQTVARDIWWTDIKNLWSHLRRTGRRRDESKVALYFEPVAFAKVDSFPTELETRGFEGLARRLAERPLDLVE